MAGPIAAVRVPTVVVYGTADTIVPARLSRQVAARPVATVELPGAGHHDPVMLVYSPHEYATSVYHQAWFDAPDYPAKTPVAPWPTGRPPAALRVDHP
ncbi:hypothetical protein ACFYUK_28915 [Nonomuraea wenchangensis]